MSNYKMSIADVVDRYTICKLKEERGKIDSSKEINDLYNEMLHYDGLQPFVDRLSEIHSSIWDLESDIRKENEKILGLEEVGRRAIILREKNKQRIAIKNEINSKFHEGYIEIKSNHGSEEHPNLILSLTTVPERLSNPADQGIKLVIKHICEQNDNDHQVHFNIPYRSIITGQPYVIPEWLENMKLIYKHLRIFRTEDMGPPTKFIPSVQRAHDPDTIILVVDDDQLYHPDMVSEHRKYQEQYKDSVICYEGRGSDILLHQNGNPRDLRDSWILCVTQVRRTFSLQHYKSVSYKKKLFDEDFFNYYVGRTFSDDALVSRYFMDKNIPMYVVPYEPENPRYETFELWDKNHGVETFPIIRSAHSISDTGCNHPQMLQHPLGARFYEPPTLGKR